jgi:hypothetical protein
MGRYEPYREVGAVDIPSLEIWNCYHCHKELAQERSGGLPHGWEWVKRADRFFDEPWCQRCVKRLRKSVGK